MKARRVSAVEMTYIALFTVLIAICSWISVPTAVPFTMQTFAVFAAIGLLGGRRAAVSVLLYILVGALGVPVFAGFGAGVGVLVGPTGGYIVGFVPAALLAGALIGQFGDGPAAAALSMAAGLFVCYAFGTAWFLFVAARAAKAMSLGQALLYCVAPFVIPDAVKIALAVAVKRRLAGRLHLPAAPSKHAR